MYEVLGTRRRKVPSHVTSLARILDVENYVTVKKNCCLMPKRKIAWEGILTGFCSRTEGCWSMKSTGWHVLRANSLHHKKSEKLRTRKKWWLGSILGISNFFMYRHVVWRPNFTTSHEVSHAAEMEGACFINVFWLAFDTWLWRLPTLFDPILDTNVT